MSEAKRFPLVEITNNINHNSCIKQQPQQQLNVSDLLMSTNNSNINSYHNNNNNSYYTPTKSLVGSLNFGSNLRSPNSSTPNTKKREMITSDHHNHNHNIHQYHHDENITPINSSFEDSDTDSVVHFGISNNHDNNNAGDDEYEFIDDAHDLSMIDNDIVKNKIKTNKSLISSTMKQQQHQQQQQQTQQFNNNITSTTTKDESMKSLMALSDIRSRVTLLDNMAKNMKEQLKSHSTQTVTLDENILSRLSIPMHNDDEIDTLNQELDFKQKEIERLQQININQENIINQLLLELERYKNQNLSFKNNETEYEIKLKENQDEIVYLNQLVKEKEDYVEYLLDQSRQDEKIRKSLHNTIQELKGNIRVVCRLRPPLPNQSPTINQIDNSLEDHYDTSIGNDRVLTLKLNSQSVTGQNSVKSTTFEFDKVFGMRATQSSVFEEISQLVQSSLDGYATCIFTYGQTGSGKTYTMEGESGEQRGMIPRTVELIFNQADSLITKGWQFEFEASFLEIYNENIHDLLTKDTTSHHHNNNTNSKSYEIRHEAGFNTVVTNLTYVPVKQPDDIFTLLNLASKNRAVAKTFCNDRSSRSHSVFQLKLKGYNQFTNEKTIGLLNLIDLAGSERIAKSGVTGDRLKETQSINKSLSCLSDVISALANKDKHIPYRNSKLTYLLQNSLGGNSKTLMFVNISTEAKDLQETLSSLRFATKVNSCEIGRAIKQSKID
ncbi:kinesin-14 [Heterostelium album PN500]|uniref:Kinesin-14 n=1 Tax=Heterostelium pallidum (strain ATCC 26659 / Pp 5 / PN500) TaxID=670386 RepID=D3B110_HETP5|nr:kinesin-14 [Heterostelium album PN500]EFA84984.1 kinesin-14 [Heterostelium album PN500]|eukprot:XP_020437094.1 kinesin-14 [Heterostelium album PN500]